MNLNRSSKHILITVDVEDWFQVENFKPWIPYQTWDSYELRVEHNTHRLLDLFDATVPKVKATFFVLGWIAEKLPHLIKAIDQRGHEVASHGFGHQLCFDQPEDQLLEDLKNSKQILEHIIGKPIYGYRAPSFSINDQVISKIKQAGYTYDSSFNAFGLNKRYGKIQLNGHLKQNIAYEIKDQFYELPISNLKYHHQNFPFGGGGYFRLIPFWIWKKAIQNILEKDQAYLFFIHPWEIDYGQPRMNNASAFFRFRHYVNLNKTYQKLNHLISSFETCQFVTCQQYLTSHTS